MATLNADYLTQLRMGNTTTRPGATTGVYNATPQVYSGAQPNQLLTNRLTAMKTAPQQSMDIPLMITNSGQADLQNLSGDPTSKYYNQTITDAYNSALKARLEAIAGQVAAGTAGYQKQLAEAGQKFDPLRNEAYTQDQLAQRALRERMANMGLSATGGKSMTLESQREMSLQNRLGEINRQQKQLETDAQFEINRLIAQGEYEKAQAVAEEAARMNEALMNEYWRQQEYGLSERGTKLQEEQFAQQKKDAEIDRYYQMFVNGHITAAQFKKKTGITVQQARSRGSSKGKRYSIQDMLDKALNEQKEAEEKARRDSLMSGGSLSSYSTYVR
jgi:hypothetical protein